MKAPQLLLFRETRQEPNNGPMFHRFIGRWIHDGREHGTEHDLSHEVGVEVGSLLDATGFEFVVNDYIKWLNKQEEEI